LRKLHNEELHALYSSQILFELPNKKDEMGGACSIYGGEEVYTGFWWGTLRERDHFEDIGVDGRVILKCIFKKWDGEHGLD